MRHSLDTGGFIIFILMGLLMLNIPVCLVLGFLGIDVIGIVGIKLLVIFACGIAFLPFFLLYDYLTTHRGSANPWT